MLSRTALNRSHPASVEGLRKGKKMHKTILVAVLGLALILGTGAAVAANTGKLKVMLINHKGVTINGTVTAKKGSKVKRCTTKAGTCTLTKMAPGTWTVVAKTASGKKGGPRTKIVKSDRKVPKSPPFIIMPTSPPISPSPAISPPAARNASART